MCFLFPYNQLYYQDWGSIHNEQPNKFYTYCTGTKLAMEKGEIPIACNSRPIDERIIARSFNQEIASNDPTAHAEILCIRKACKN